MKIYEWFETFFKGLVDLITAPMNLFIKEFSDRLKTGLTNWLLEMNPAGTDLLAKSLKPLIDNPDCPDSLKPILKEWTSHTPPVIAALAPLIGAMVAYPAVSAAFRPSLTELEQVMNEQVRPAILSPMEIISAKRRAIVSAAFASQEFAWLGFDDERQGILDKVTMFYPSPNDFIQFAVRDTFNADIVKKYGYDTDYPETIDEQGAKAGISSEWMHHYWRAHWQLPSPTMAYEMLHRGKITKADAETILRISDYAPYFIKPMIDIAYNPYTRVDVHRMYDAGVLSREQVKQAYKDIGYDEEHAENLTKWTTAAAMSEESDLTKAEIKSAYAEGALSRLDAEAGIKKMGYDAAETKIILDMVDKAQEKALRNREKNILVKQFVKNKLTIAAFTEALKKMAYSEREYKIIYNEALLQVKESQA